MWNQPTGQKTQFGFPLPPVSLRICAEVRYVMLWHPYVRALECRDLFKGVRVNGSASSVLTPVAPSICQASGPRTSVLTRGRLPSVLSSLLKGVHCNGRFSSLVSILPSSEAEANPGVSRVHVPKASSVQQEAAALSAKCARVQIQVSLFRLLPYHSPTPPGLLPSWSAFGCL